MDARNVPQSSEILDEIDTKIPEIESDIPICNTSAAQSHAQSEANSPTSESLVAGDVLTLSKPCSFPMKEMVKLKEEIEKCTEENKLAQDRKYEQQERLILELSRRNELLERLITLQANNGND